MTKSRPAGLGPDGGAEGRGATDQYRARNQSPAVQCADAEISGVGRDLGGWLRLARQPAPWQSLCRYFMKTAIQRRGNSLALRIPKAFAEQANMKRGTEVSLTLEKQRLIVAPITPKASSLKRLP